MSKALLVAIQPKWLKMILDGEKKFEFRDWKNLPKNVPVGTVLYFYCTKAKPIYVWHPYDCEWCNWEDIKYDDDIYGSFSKDELAKMNGKVVAKAVVKDVGKITNWGIELELTDKDGFFICEINIAKAYNIGYTDQTYALELDQAEAIEPKDVTEFVSLSKLDKARKERNKQEDIQTALRYGDWQMEYNTVDKFVAYYGKPEECKLTKPPQSRTWIYVGDE